MLTCASTTKSDTKLLRITTFLLAGLLISTHAFAETCNVDAMLTDLQSQVTGPLDADQLTSARQILSRHCSEQLATAVAATEEAVRAETAANVEDDEPLTLFGIEFNKAEDDSEGHKRLRKQ